MLIGNRIGGHSADCNLSSTLVIWPFLMILSLLLIAVLVHCTGIAWPNLGDQHVRQYGY